VVQAIKLSVTEQAKPPEKVLHSAESAALGRRLRILFTEGASLSARQTLYPLGGKYEIDVIDPDPLCQCRFSSYIRRFRRSPSFAKQPAEFLRFLARLLRNGQYDVVLPTHEQAYLLSRFRESISSRVGLAMPPFESLERLQNKAQFSRLLSELGLPQPETVSITSNVELNRDWQFPLYLKLPHSTAGSGVFFVSDRATLDRTIKELEGKQLFGQNVELLIQQPARGVLSTVQAVFNRGEMIGVHTFEARRLGVGGMSTARVSADHTIVREHAAKVGRYLNWHGAFFIDYFYDHQSHQPEYIECNPRIGETVNAMLSGVNLPELLVRVSLGESPIPAPPARTGVCTHNSLMILMSAAYEGSKRRTLIREIRECAAERGLYANSEDELVRPSDDPGSRLPRLWTTLKLLAYPKIARRIVATTIANYALPETAIDEIKRLPLDLLERPL